MTLFGKLVFTCFGIGTLFLLFFGVSSFIKHDAASAEMANQKESSQASHATSSQQGLDLAAASSSNSDVIEGNASSSESFTDILSNGGKLSCSISQAIGTLTSTGMVYIDGAHVRADFSTSVMNVTVKSSLIVMDGYMYSWTDTATSGVKTKMATRDTQGKVTPTSSSARTWNGDQVKTYTCRPWAVDVSKFVLPETVIFSNVK